MDNDLSKLIGTRINTLLARNDKKQKDLAQYLGVKDNTISYFISGTRMPNTEQIKKISTFFNCSSDYLLGLSDTPIKDKDTAFIRNYTGLDEDTIQDFHKAKKIIPPIMNNDFERVTYQSILVSSVLQKIQSRSTKWLDFVMNSKKNMTITPNNGLVIEGIGKGYEEAEIEYRNMFDNKKQGGANYGNNPKEE